MSMSSYKGKVLFGASVYSHLASFHKPFIIMLQERGYEVFACANPNSGRKDEIESLGVQCVDIPFSRNPFHTKNIKAIRALKTLFRRHYFNLIHVHTPVAAFTLRWCADRYNQGAVLYTAHGFHFYKGAPLMNWLLYYPAEWLARKWTDGLIVMNDEDYQSAQKLKFIPETNLFLVGGVGIDIGQYSVNKGIYSIRDEYNISHNDTIITYVGALTKRKNQMALLRVWKAITTEFPHTHLLLVGRGEEEQNLRDYVEDEGLSNVNFLGYRLDVPQIIQESEIITLVSHQEGLPRCIMEAMACAKPIVATNIRGTRDLVRDGVNGLLVSQNNDKELLMAMKKLLRDEGLRYRMGKGGNERIQKYSIQHVSAQMEHIYDRYIEINPPTQLVHQ